MVNLERQINNFLQRFVRPPQQEAARKVLDELLTGYDDAIVPEEKSNPHADVESAEEDAEEGL